MIRALLVAVLLLTAENGLANTGSGPLDVERRLLGTWDGGPACMGEIEFRADGSFTRRNYSPGGHELRGTWKLQGSASPPILTLKCDQSTNPMFVGWVLTVALVQLNDKELAYTAVGDETPMRFKRKKAAEQDPQRADASPNATPPRD